MYIPPFRILACDFLFYIHGNIEKYQASWQVMEKLLESLENDGEKGVLQHWSCRVRYFYSRGWSTKMTRQRAKR